MVTKSRVASIVLCAAAALSACGDPSSNGAQNPALNHSVASQSEVIADTEAADLEQAALRHFIGICVLQVSQPHRIEAMASALEWSELPAEVAAVMAPREEGVPWSGWAFRDPNLSAVMVGIADSSGFRAGSLSGGKTCTMSVAIGDVDEFLHQLVDALELDAADGQHQIEGQRVTSWRRHNPPQIVTVVDAKALGVPGYTATILAQDSDG